MGADQPSVLLVEDEPAQREVLAYNLEAEGFGVAKAETGDDALMMVDETQPDVIILDWMLPGVSGIEICRRLKSNTDTRKIPVIMLTARSEEADRVRGLETGADDYVIKPYSVIELMARVRTQLRRVRPASIGERLEYGDILLDAETHRVTRGGEAIKLGPTEFRLLSTFMEKPGRVWSREQLLDRVWGRDIYVDTRTVDVHIGRLRKALCQHGGEDPVRTVRGAGTFEGADAAWLDPQTVLLATGLRTNADGAAQVAASLHEMGITVVQVGLPYGAMHLMGQLRFADRDLAFAWPGRVPYAAVEALRAHGYSVLFLPDESEAKRGMALNFVTLAPRRILMPAGNQATRSFYEDAGITCHTVQVDELLKAAGGIGCLTGILYRELET